MKKIYTLLAAAAVATGSLFAAPNRGADARFTMTDLGAAKLNAAQAYTTYMTENGREMGPKYSWEDANGNTWTLNMVVNGEVTDYFSFSDSSTSGMTGAEIGEMYNHYFCIATFTYTTTNSSNNGRAIKLLAIYPTEGYFVDNEDAWKDDSIKGYWGGSQKDPVSLTNFCSSSFPGYKTFVVSSAFGYLMNSDSWAIVNNSSYWQNYSSYGVYQTISSGTATAAGYAGAGTTVTPSNYDAETESIDMPVVGQMKNASGSTVYNANVAFSGPIDYFQGFDPKNINFGLGEVHIVNTGKADQDSIEYYDKEEWGPLTRYYMLVCGENLTYTNGWSASEMPSRPYLADGASTADANWFYGALYSAADSENPYDLWTMTTFTFAQSGNQYVTDDAPEAGEMIYGGYNSLIPWSPEDGTRMVYKGYYYYPDVSDVPTQAGCGTTVGFGLIGKDIYRNNLNLSSDAQVYYHYDSTDYTKVKMINSVGELVLGNSKVDELVADTNKATISVAGGIVNVTMAEAGQIAVYNVAGALVKNVKAAAGTTSFELGKGLYIVKAGKQVAKVIL
jgi:hypothetical protein